MLALVGCVYALGCGQGAPTARLGPPAATPAQVARQIEAVRAGDAVRLVAAASLSEADWESLRGLRGLRELVLDQRGADDSRAEIFATLPDLERLVLRGSPLTDAGFAQLAGCAKLRDLNVPQAACTPEGIRALAGLEQLRSLRLGSSRLAGPDVCAAIAELRHLRTLHLIDVPIGDAGLQSLTRIDGLWTLYLDGAGVSDDAWTEYFEARPHVHVHVDQAHHDRDPARGHD